MGLPDNASLKYVQLEVLKEHILVVTLNRPQAMNALNWEADNELAGIWDYFEATPQLWVAILRGTGTAFCAGFDLKSGLKSKGTVRPAPTGFGGLSLRRTCLKPIIAAVNGTAFGGGLELALSCDIILASERAEFALPEPKVGLAALAGGLVRLPRMIGYHAAMGMILTAQRVSASEGYRLGFVNEVVPHDKLFDRAVAIADLISACSPDSIRASKQVVLETLKDPDVFHAMDEQMNLEQVSNMLTGPNRLEGLRAFAEKRKPQWKSNL